MNRTKTILRACAVPLTLLVAACAYPVNGPEDGPPISERFPITVSPQMQSLRVGFDPDGRGLDSRSVADLQRFARNYMSNGSGSIRVSAPRRLDRAAGVVADQLAALGVPRTQIMTGIDDVPNPADEVKLTYIGYQAHAEPCGDWSSNVGYTAANQQTANFGCATQHNLAAMVADPRDLATPKPLGPADVGRSLAVLEKYRKGEATITAKTDEQSGAVSKAIPSGGAK